jgi:hypothetical protein
MYNKEYYARNRKRIREYQRLWYKKHKILKDKDETRHKQSIAHKGKHHTPETKKYVSDLRKRQWADPEFREKMLRSQVHPRHSDSTKKRISVTKKQQWRERRDEFMKKCHSPEVHQKISQILRERLKDPLLRAQRSDARKKNWQDPEYRDRITKSVFLANQMKPNKTERAVQCLLDELFPNTYRFVGDGTLIIGGKSPDFYDGTNRLIEFFGDYWHRGQDPSERIDYFSGYGYRTLVIWENELSDIGLLKNKIIRFHSGA